MNFVKRSMWEVGLLTIFTFGLYAIYWSVVTKRELNRAGATIPHAILMFVPFANYYFWYRYAQSYVTIVKKSDNNTDVIVYFLLAIFPMLLCVYNINGFSDIIRFQGYTSISAAASALLIKTLFFQQGFNEYSQ